MKRVTLRTIVTATVEEEWSVEVSDDFDMALLDDPETLNGDRADLRILSVKNDFIYDERDRTTLSYAEQATHKV